MEKALYNYKQSFQYTHLLKKNSSTKIYSASNYATGKHSVSEIIRNKLDNWNTLGILNYIYSVHETRSVLELISAIKKHSAIEIYSAPEIEINSTLEINLATENIVGKWKYSQLLKKNWYTALK